MNSSYQHIPDHPPSHPPLTSGHSSASTAPFPLRRFRSASTSLRNYITLCPPGASAKTVRSSPSAASSLSRHEVIPGAARPPPVATPPTRRSSVTSPPPSSTTPPSGGILVVGVTSRLPAP